MKKLTENLLMFQGFLIILTSHIFSTSLPVTLEKGFQKYFKRFLWTPEIYRKKRNENSLEESERGRKGVEKKEG